MGNTAEAGERAYGERIDDWLDYFRETLEDVIGGKNAIINVHEYQAHAKETCVPDRFWRKRMIQADILTVVDPDDLFFTFLAEEGREYNPLMRTVVGYTRNHLDGVMSALGQMPKIPVYDPTQPSGFRNQPWIFAVSLDKEDDLKPTLQKVLAY
jgi:hypothetical protein